MIQLVDSHGAHWTMAKIEQLLNMIFKGAASRTNTHTHTHTHASVLAWGHAVCPYEALGDRGYY